MIKVGSLFSGIGGIDLGFEQAGFEIVWANDIDAEACKTYRHNFPNTQLVEGDVRDIDPRTLPDIDVLVAGFPCQPFSIAGVSKKKSLGRPTGFEDKTQGTLFFDVARIVKEKKPKIVFMENVKNFATHDGGKTLEVVKGTMEELGYTNYYQVLNAKDYGIPQNRERVFTISILGSKNYQFSR